MKVSWQLTGIRTDPFANENRIPIEVLKEDVNQGKYLHPRTWTKAKGVAVLESVNMNESQKLANEEVG